MMHNIKKGIIIIFSDNENEINRNNLNKFLNKDITEFCFVNNGSKDKTLEKLEGIKNKISNNISIIDIKKNKGLNAAIKGGVRYLINNKNLKLILYLEFYKKIDFVNLEFALNAINCIEERKILLTNSNPRSIFKNVFSLEQLIKDK